MKNLFFSLLVLPLHLFAQKADSLVSDLVNVTNDKLSTWYKSTYKVANTQPSVITYSAVKPVSNPNVRFKSTNDMFLYSPYLYANRPFSTISNLTNTPYYNGYLDRTGGATVGQVLLAGGINYILDKAISAKEKKSKKK